MTVLVFLGTDLSARLRIDRASVSLGSVMSSAGALDQVSGLDPDVVVVDLDWASEDLIAGIAPTFPKARLIGYHSHVDADIADVARSHGIVPFPRSRFWRETKELLASKRLQSDAGSPPPA